LIAATLAIAILALAGIALHLMHVLGLLLVLSIGVDYGVFLAEARLDGEQSATTVVGVAVACASTVLSFGLLAASSNPALAAVGITTAIGVILSFALAPTIYAILFPRSSRRDSARSGSDAPP
jgi:predicted exporter